VSVSVFFFYFGSRFSRLWSFPLLRRKDAVNPCTKRSFSERRMKERGGGGRSPKSINIRRGKLQAETLMDPARVVGRSTEHWWWVVMLVADCCELSAEELHPFPVSIYYPVEGPASRWVFVILCLRARGAYGLQGFIATVFVIPVWSFVIYKWDII